MIVICYRDKHVTLVYLWRQRKILPPIRPHAPRFIQSYVHPPAYQSNFLQVDTPISPPAHTLIRLPRRAPLWHFCDRPPRQQASTTRLSVHQLISPPAYHSTSLSVHTLISPPAYQSTHLLFRQPVTYEFAYLSVHQPISRPAYHSNSLSVHPLINPPAYQSTRLSVRQLISLPVYQSISLSVHICPFDGSLVQALAPKIKTCVICRVVCPIPALCRPKHKWPTKKSKI